MNFKRKKQQQKIRHTHKQFSSLTANTKRVRPKSFTRSRLIDEKEIHRQKREIEKSLLWEQ